MENSGKWIPLVRLENDRLELDYQSLDTVLNSVPFRPTGDRDCNGDMILRRIPIQVFSVCGRSESNHFSEACFLIRTLFFPGTSADVSNAIGDPNAELEVWSNVSEMALMTGNFGVTKQSAIVLIRARGFFAQPKRESIDREIFSILMSISSLMLITFKCGITEQDYRDYKNIFPNMFNGWFMHKVIFVVTNVYYKHCLNLKCNSCEKICTPLIDPEYLTILFSYGSKEIRKILEEPLISNFKWKFHTNNSLLSMLQKLIH